MKLTDIVPAEAWVELEEEINERSALEKMSLWTDKTQAISATTWNGRHIHIRLSGATAAVEHGRMQIGGAGLWVRK